MKISFIIKEEEGHVGIFFKSEARTPETLSRKTLCCLYAAEMGLGRKERLMV